VNVVLGSVWDVIALEASHESQLWADALRPEDEQEREPVFSTLGKERFALGLETIYEGYLLHYGTPRLFAPGDADTALLLGDYLYAHGLVRIAELGDVAAVGDLAELISLCAQLRADRTSGAGELWAATAAWLGEDCLDEARAELRDRADAVPLETLARERVGEGSLETALAAHAGRQA
jgi:hypothetical protein